MAESAEDGQGKPTAYRCLIANCKNSANDGIGKAKQRTAGGNFGGNCAPQNWQTRAVRGL